MAAAGSIRKRLTLDMHDDVAGRDDEEPRRVAHVDFVVRGRGARNHLRFFDAGDERSVVREVTHEREDEGGGKGELGRGTDLADFEPRVIAKRQGHTARGPGRRPAASERPAPAKPARGMDRVASRDGSPARPSLMTQAKDPHHSRGPATVGSFGDRARHPKLTNHAQFFFFGLNASLTCLLIDL